MLAAAGKAVIRMMSSDFYHKNLLILLFLAVLLTVARTGRRINVFFC